MKSNDEMNLKKMAKRLAIAEKCMTEAGGYEPSEVWDITNKVLCDNRERLMTASPIEVLLESLKEMEEIKEALNEEI